jgi:hypothetical protein
MRTGLPRIPTILHVVDVVSASNAVVVHVANVGCQADNANAHPIRKKDAPSVK